MLCYDEAEEIIDDPYVDVEEEVDVIIEIHVKAAEVGSWVSSVCLPLWDT